MLRSEKKQFVSELETVCKNFSSVFVTHYRGMTVAQLFALKTSLKAKQGKIKVVKNTLFRIAATNAARTELVTMASGPVAIIYSNDAAGTAKLIDEFAKKHDKFKIIGGSVDGQSIDTQGVMEIAKLPSLDELRARIIALLQTPATNIVRLLKAPGESIARVLNAHAQKQ